MLGYNVWDTINCSVNLICRIVCSDKFKVIAERESHKLAGWSLLSPNSKHYWPLTGASHGSSQSCLCEHFLPCGSVLPVLGGWPCKASLGSPVSSPSFFYQPSPPFSPSKFTPTLPGSAPSHCLLYTFEKTLLYLALAPSSRALWTASHLFFFFLYLHNWTGKMCFKIACMNI